MNKIKELREEKGWLQKDVEARLNIGRGTLSNYECEKRSLTPDLIHRFCDLFGCTADYLLCRSDTPRAALSPEDAALLAAFRDAPENVKDGIRSLLRLEDPVTKEKQRAS